MCKSFPKKFLSILMSLVLLLTTAIYADNVVIGVAPGIGDKTQSLNATTTYLQNQYSGPGLRPNSSMTYDTPIQGVTLDEFTGNMVSSLANSTNTADAGPRVNNISSPAANNSSIRNYRQNAQVISNGALLSNVDSNTSDMGPTVHEISSPVAGGVGLQSGDQNGPGVANYQTGDPNRPKDPVPSYTTNTNNVSTIAQDNGVII